MGRVGRRESATFTVTGTYKGKGKRHQTFRQGRRGSERHHQHRERLQKGRAGPLLDVAKPKVRDAARDAAPAHTASRSRPPTAPQRNGYPGTCFFFSRAPTKCCCPGAAGLLACLPAVDARSCSALRAFSHRARRVRPPHAQWHQHASFCREAPDPVCWLLFWLASSHLQVCAILCAQLPVDRRDVGRFRGE